MAYTVLGFLAHLCKGLAIFIKKERIIAEAAVAPGGIQQLARAGSLGNQGLFPGAGQGNALTKAQSR